MSTAPSPTTPEARARRAIAEFTTRWHKLTPRTRESVVGGMVGLALFVGWNVYSYQHDISTATGDNLAEAVIDKLPCNSVDRIRATPNQYYCNMDAGSVLVLSYESSDDAIRDAVMFDDQGWYVDRSGAARRVLLASQSRANFEIAEARVAG